MSHLAEPHLSVDGVYYAVFTKSSSHGDVFHGGLWQVVTLAAFSYITLSGKLYCKCLLAIEVFVGIQWDNR